MGISMDLGELIKKLRTERGITRNELAEQAGVSLSHLEKIEAGLRNPGMGTFVKIMVVLDINISLQGVGATIQEKCVLIVRDILMGSTEDEAKYLAKMVECMAENLTMLMRS